MEHDNWKNSTDPISFVLKKDLLYEPGEHYNYNSGATHLLSVIISKVSGMSTLAYANEKLFQKLQIENIQWDKMKDGYHDGGGLGLNMRALDLMKIGRMLANYGTYSDEMVVSAKWVEQLFSLDEKSSTRWGMPKSKHGYCWYQAKFEGNEVNYGMGYGGQFIIIVPNKDIVIVAMHDHDTADGLKNQNAFLRQVLPDLLNRTY